jgi:hypothetical protein
MSLEVIPIWRERLTNSTLGPVAGFEFQAETQRNARISTLFSPSGYQSRSFITHEPLIGLERLFTGTCL